MKTVSAVNRCGWFERDRSMLFALGKTILAPRGLVREAAAADREEYQPESINADADILWAMDISQNEEQIINGLRCAGDPVAQQQFLLDCVMRYPQLAFGIGCAAGAPLIRFAQAAGLCEVAGFSVLMHSGATGRQGRQGKTTWNQVVANFYGCPEVGERLRYADRTRAQAGVLLSTCSDLTVHLEDLQKIAREAKKAATEELDYLFHLVAAGMDRERGARGGGGRKTRLFKTVLFATAEYDVTASMPAGSGVHDRVLKLPPLLPEQSDENRIEAERLSGIACAHYGHAGREYIGWLVKFVNEHGTQELIDAVRAALET